MEYKSQTYTTYKCSSSSNDKFEKRHLQEEVETVLRLLLSGTSDNVLVGMEADVALVRPSLSGEQTSVSISFSVLW